MFSVDHLTIQFKNKILVHDLSFYLRSHEILSLIGKSGAGKSITAYALLNLLQSPFQVHGTVKTYGKIAIIFQESALNPLHTIARHFKEILSKKSAKGRLKELLSFVGLSSMDPKIYPHELSEGERQRVMIALALALEPQVLIADEPTSFLDEKTQKSIKELFRHLKEKCSILLISHDITMAKDLADRIMVMHQGRIVEENTTENILQNPKHSQTKELINPYPQIDKATVAFDVPILLRVRDLKVKHHNKVILKGLSFDLRKGETLGFMGESGAGKTTLAHALLGLIPVESGEIFFHHYPLRTVKNFQKIRRSFQIVFQGKVLNSKWPIERIVEEGLSIHEPTLSKVEKKKRILDLLRELDLPFDVLKAYPHEISGGEYQRISIARSLVLNPLCLILDEPTSALDTITQDALIKLLIRIQKDRGLSYFLISHDSYVIHSLAHRILELRNGNFV